uniref:protein-disulfide reductase n=1 Tax=Parastrongyloides trichosuri TaxID=131310 RepID=A0A0N4ZXJ9_PARTI
MVRLDQHRYGSNVAELFKSTSLIKQDGSKEEGSKLLKDKITALYFSASWCGPCRQFTPILKSFYDKINKGEKKFEVVFVSLDRNESSMKGYFKEHMGNWLRTEYDSSVIEGLAEECGVSTIPSLKIVKSNGDVTNIPTRDDITMYGGDKAEELIQSWKKKTD